MIRSIPEKFVRDLVKFNYLALLFRNVTFISGYAIVLINLPAVTIDGHEGAANPQLQRSSGIQVPFVSQQVLQPLFDLIVCLSFNSLNHILVA